ncbi:UDP-N-acetylmuramoyl-L-alanyl-D-glutamate--2,6-diaminopimelate ligase [Bacillus mexicanus]|uniref:UDP-N-acetylmuramoyl-L-alanyl-D-glutamate--2, 6-diaminopimelate ligase n=1 Tax=Bacillus mexicanus TaxID=2834415 RepID=UPI003D2582C9
MKLNTLLNQVNYELVTGSLNINITNITYDSRKVQKGSLYVCIQGEKLDGHSFVEEAIKKGAAAILVQKPVKINDKRRTTVIKVDNSRVVLSQISNIFFGSPSKKMNIVGVTGTNGKTSISYLISEMLMRIKKNVGVIGTIGIQLNNSDLNLSKTTPTTPDSLELHMILNEMIKQKATDVVMEVTSIALDQHRVDDCSINVGIFTNLTEDHLDYHGDMETYQKAKKKLFDLCKVAVINTDDPTGRYFTDYFKEKNIEKDAQLITYGIENDADITANNIVLKATGSLFTLDFKGEEYAVKINLPGKFNIYNTLAAIGAATYLGVPIENVIETLARIKGARGRFESIETKKGASVVIDYAHTPDALENVLKTIVEFNPRKIITVFGCGGDRDKTKRPIMGGISSKYSDLSIITSDNPRTENPSEIIKDIEKGINRSNYLIISDREEAIKSAIEKAGKDDLVLIAGKGHETYQMIDQKTIHFDDMEVVKKYI